MQVEEHNCIPELSISFDLQTANLDFANISRYDKDYEPKMFLVGSENQSL